MEKKEIKDGMFLFLVEELSIGDPIKYLEDKGIDIEASAKIILAKALKEGWFKKIFSSRGKIDKKTIKVVVLDSEHISGIGTKHTAEDVFETADEFKFTDPTPRLVFPILEKFDAEDFINDMNIDELVFLHKPVRIKGDNYVLNIHLSSRDCSYKISIGATYFFPRRKWGEKTGFVFVKQS